MGAGAGSPSSEERQRWHSPLTASKIILRAHVEAIHAVYNLPEFGPGAWYEAALDTCLETGMALIPPQKKDFVEVQSADGKTAFCILNGEILDL